MMFLLFLLMTAGNVALGYFTAILLGLAKFDLGKAAAPQAAAKGHGDAAAAASH